MSAQGYTNQEFADEAHAERREQREQRVEERSEAEQKKQRVLDSIREKTVTVYVDGEHRAKFTRIMGDEEQWFREMYRKEQNGELSEEDDEAAEQRMGNILTDHAVPDWIDREFIEALPARTKIELFDDIVTGGQEADESENLRDRT